MAVETVVPPRALTERAELGEPRVGAGVLSRALLEDICGPVRVQLQPAHPAVTLAELAGDQRRHAGGVRRGHRRALQVRVVRAAAVALAFADEPIRYWVAVRVDIRDP